MRALRAILAGGILLLATSGCITIDLFGGGEQAALVETVVRGSGGPKILLLDIDGVIGGADIADSLFGGAPPSTVARVREMLDRARADEDVRAILLRIDSPGGTATASEQVHAEIKRFREERGLPVMAQMLSTAASGGFMVAMAADTVQAHPTTVTGSIGVIFTSVNFAGLMQKIGIEDQTITAGEFKDAGSPFRRLLPLEREQLQTIVDDLHARFRDIVAQGRPDLPVDQVHALSDGRVFSGPQAAELGLVDSVGTLEDAVIALEARLGARQSRVVSYHRPREIRRNLHTRSGLAGAARLAAASATPEGFALRGLEQILGRPGFHYLWWPGLMAVGSGN